ncbi:sulfotransferase [Nocardioides sp. HB32]
MTTPRLLFLVGLARSGTTALLHVLNAHPEVVIGMERYKRVVSGGCRPSRLWQSSSGPYG